MYSGYIPVGDGKHYFYWYESRLIAFLATRNVPTKKRLFVHRSPKSPNKFQSIAHCVGMVLTLLWRYRFIESARNRTQDPVILWLNGGAI
jgi:hypothetical protein